MRHGIVFGNYRDRIPDWKRYFFFVKISKASVGNFKSEQIKTDWVSSPDPLRRARPSTALKNKFNALRDLSHRIWPEVVEKLEREKRERKERKEGRSKPAVPATPISRLRRGGHHLRLRKRFQKGWSSSSPSFDRDDDASRRESAPSRRDDDVMTPRRYLAGFGRRSSLLLAMTVLRLSEGGLGEMNR
ncbi:unnamed protein product [Microthlaspi erraticum]|uniref:Uncharacterized protein n=1 Tax=Microthlaspi erraticum TaxID=1685480 RepID=A0A6D2LDN5_9BRAS|nr:unnamed protein product [Microthlaspi erraticum]